MSRKKSIAYGEVAGSEAASIMEGAQAIEAEAGVDSSISPPFMALERDIRPEVELICACARTAIDSSTSERVKDLIEGGIDWKFAIEKAYLHSVLPLLYWNLNIACRESVPEEEMQRLRHYFHAHTSRNLLLASNLLKIVRVLEAEGIPAIAFKGPILATTAYKNLSLRAFCDLDILVRLEDVLRAKDLLVAAGYEMQHQFADSEKLVRFLPKKKDYKLRHNEDDFNLELHWRITGIHFSFSPDMDLLWSRLVEERLAGERVLSFRPEDLLLILCVHGSKHIWSRLQWICDVAELIRANPEIKLDDVIEDAQRLGCERMLLLGLHLANDVLKLPLPAYVLQKIVADPVIKTLAGTVNERNWGETYAPITASQLSRFHLMMRERFQDRVKLGFYGAYKQARQVLSPNKNDEEFVKLPLSLSSLYYLVRPIRLIKKRGAHSIRRFIKFRGSNHKRIGQD